MNEAAGITALIAAIVLALILIAYRVNLYRSDDPVSVTDADRRKADELAYAVRDAEVEPARLRARDAIAAALAAERATAKAATRGGMTLKRRNWNRSRAVRGGYFWTNCPLCGQEFGGHEWRDIDGKVSSIPKPGAGPDVGTAICPDCTRAGRGRSAERPA